MNFYKDFVQDETVYTDYEDLKKNFKLKIPANFNFAYDIVDRYAQTVPSKLAMVWCDDTLESHHFTFSQISERSKQTAEFLKLHGIKKGDTVMLILRRRYEFWFFLLALHRIGAIAVPATNQLLTKDIEYRTNAAEIKMIVSYEDDEVQTRIESALKNSPTVKNIVTVGKNRDGWLSYYDEIENFKAEDFDSESDRPTKKQRHNARLLYFRHKRKPKNGSAQLYLPSRTHCYC